LLLLFWLTPYDPVLDPWDWELRPLLVVLLSVFFMALGKLIEERVQFSKVCNLIETGGN